MTDARTAAPSPWFAWDFLDEIGDWSLRFAALIALGALVLSREPSFALGCLMGAGSTSLLVHYATRVALRREQYDLRAPLILIVGRLVVVAAVLLLTFFAPTVLNPLGTIVGIVTFDITLAVAGSFVALRRGFGGSQESR